MITSRWAGAVLAAAVLVATAGASAQDVAADPAVGGGGRSSTRIALQGRLDFLNTLGNETGIDISGGGGGGGFEVNGSLQPVVTAGVRLDRLFLGAGLGFYGYSYSNCEDEACDRGDVFSGFGWSLVPTVAFDLLSERDAAGYLLGSVTLLNIGSQTEEDIETGVEMSGDGDFGWGLNLGVGVRGKISEGIAIGTEWGWGFINITPGGDDEDTIFAHAIFGNVMFEASVGI